MLRLEEAEAIMTAAKRVVAARRKMAAMTQRHAQTSDMRESQRMNVDLDAQAMEIERLTAALHVACVDAGVADARDPEHYKARALHLSSFHDHHWQPPTPKALDSQKRECMALDIQTEAAYIPIIDNGNAPTRKDETMKIETGKVFYFGWQRTPNTVTRVTELENNSQYVARIELVGPRGGKSIAFVGHDGTARKI